MAETRFGVGSQAYYGDVVQSSTPASKGLSLVETNIYSGKAQAETDPKVFGTKTEMRLWKDGRPASGLINNKLYENGKELSKEQIQAGSNVNYRGIAGELATLGLRTPVGTKGAEFVRDPAAEKKFAEEFRKQARANYESIANQTGKSYDAAKQEALAQINASDEDIINRFGGVNKEGRPGSDFGINALMESTAFPAKYQPGSGTGLYAGTGPAQYIRGSRAITESDILTLGKAVGNATNDQATAAKARQQLQSIFENDPSYIRREQARDALSYGLPGYPGGPQAPSTSIGADGRPITTGAQGTGGAQGAGGMGGTGSLTTSYTATDGTRFTDQSAFVNYQKMLAESTATQQKKLEDRRSAFQILREEFTRYGLGQLVGDIENLLIQGTPPAEYAFQLRQTPTYKQRFVANEQRIKKGLRALDEASYIGLEDQYQDVMRRYGLPESYYSRDEIGTQKGFEKLIAANVSNIELERRIQNTQSRLFDANPEVMAAMRQFYPNVTGGEILAYALDPETAEPLLERKIAAAEIGGAALRAGLTTGLPRAEELAAAGITKAAAQEQYGKIASGLERGKRLSEIYQQPTYTQEVAEAEAFALPNAEQARRQRRKLGQLETAEFGGTSGVTGGALGRERAGQY